MMSGDDVHGKAIFKLRKCLATDAMMLVSAQSPRYGVNLRSPFINSMMSKHAFDSRGDVKISIELIRLSNFAQDEIIQCGDVAD